MKKQILLIALASMVLAGCKKEQLIVQGQSYHIKGNIFNKGVYQPAQPVMVNNLYTDPISGLPYANVTDQNGTVWYIPQEDLK